MNISLRVKFLNTELEDERMEDVSLTDANFLTFICSSYGVKKDDKIFVPKDPPYFDFDQREVVLNLVTEKEAEELRMKALKEQIGTGLPRPPFEVKQGGKLN